MFMTKLLEWTTNAFLGLVFLILCFGIGGVFYTWYELAQPIETMVNGVRMISFNF